MRLLIVDEEIIAGGVDTLRRQLIPPLAGLLDAIVWVLPGHVAEDFRGIEKQCPNLRIETLNSPGGIPRLKEAVARRIHNGLPRALVNDRLRRLARRHQSALCMTTCVFGQEIPAVDLPVVGLVSDINPALPEPILANISHWVEQSAMTLTVSDFISSALKHLKPGSSDKIHSIPLAPPSGIEPARQVTQGHFYYPAVPHGHKGHLTLLEAAGGLAKRGLDFRLTLTGPGLDQFAQAEGGNEVIRKMRAFLSSHRQLLNGRVVVPGDARPAHVEQLYSECSCVVLPSSYEGFGFPLSEALANGKRVICSDIPPFREQIQRYGCEPLATFVPAGDASTLEQAMAHHLAGDNTPGLTPGQLKERLGRWTWRHAARRCQTLLEGIPRHG